MLDIKQLSRVLYTHNRYSFYNIYTNNYRKYIHIVTHRTYCTHQSYAIYNNMRTRVVHGNAMLHITGGTKYPDIQ